MKISDLFYPGSIALNSAPQDKAAALEALVQQHQAAGNLEDIDRYRQDILAREAQGTTAVGNGVAIPHAKSGAVRRPGLAAMTVPCGVDCDAMDGAPVRLLFMIAAPDESDFHLEVLAKLMGLLMDAPFRDRLCSAATEAAFLQCIDEAEAAKDGSAVPEAPPAADDTAYDVLAVTACPTGIAHTYMAAEALEKAAQAMGIRLKVETNGSGGVQNALTAEEIAQATGILIAADKSVAMARFRGKRLISVPVADGIKRPEALLRQAMAPDAPVYQAAEEAPSSPVDQPAKAGKPGLGHALYQHLMNGVSHMLPFVVAGGIFIALAFLIDTVAGAPQDGNFGMHTPVAAFFKTIGNVAFNFMIPILGGYIGMSIADRPGLLVGFVGGYLATTGATFASVAGDVPSGFLGALFAGFAGGYLMLGFEKLCQKLPKSLDGIKPVLLFPLVGLGLIAVLMCAVNPVMGFLNTGLSKLLAAMGGTSRVALGVILGAMMAIDMGGPCNKAAYVFGTAAITNGNYDIMAAVMIGGMVPPLAIALATTFFPAKFTPEERKNGPVNYIMGLSFITEGAIPYAASDPARVIPACALGAGLAGGLSMLFRCTLMAPHGGIFVFAVVGHWPLYLLSLAAGALFGMLLLAAFKRKAPPAVKE